MGSDFLGPLAAAGVAIAGLAGIPGLVSILAQIRSKTPKDNFYEDIDGKSTPESVAAFSNTRPKIAILVLSIIGFGLSLPVSILGVLHPVRHGLNLPNWLLTATWVSSSK